MDLSALPAPTSTLLWTAFVDVGDRIDLGPSRGGHWFKVPILGGTFMGGPDHAALSGTVLGGGSDRQMLRPDGVRELCATYDMKTEDGAVLALVNRVTVDDSRSPERYAISVIEVSAPDGPHAWLNRRVIIGTLKSRRPEVDQVVIQAFLVDTI